jgi:hypothetical protein
MHAGVWRHSSSLLSIHVAHAAREVVVQALPDEMLRTNTASIATEMRRIVDLPLGLRRTLTSLQKREVSHLKGPCAWEVVAAVINMVEFSFCVRVVCA